MKADHMRRELSRIDRIDAPDLLSDIQRRTELGAPSVEPKALGPRTGFGRVALVLGVVTAVVASSLVLSRVFPDGEPATPGGGDLVGSIVLGIRDDGGVSRLYVVEPDGSGSREIGSLGSEARIRGASVSISPDGTRAAFIRFGEDDRGLWVSNVDGSDAVRLSEATPNSDFEPAWSPDGTKIVFSRNRVGHGELFVIDADGSNLTQITTNEVGQDASPAWSPDGSRIAFARNSGGPVDIWVVDAVGGNEGQLTTFSEKESGGPDYPDWSPDGRRIVFAAVAPNAASGNSSLKPHDLWMIDADGSNLTRLTDTPEDEIHPRWSPDGGSVVYLIGAGVDPTTVDIRGPYRTAILDVVTGETRSLDAPTGNVVETTLQWIRTTPLQTAETPLTGKALADSLNLELLAEKPPDCMDFVEVADPAGYCIEDVVVRGSRDSYELGQLLRGYVPTQLDLNIYALQAQIAETPSDDPTVVALYQQLKELLAQRDLALYQQLKELLAQRDLSTAALAIGGSIAGLSARQPEADPVEVELEQVEAQVDALGLKFAVASDKEQDALLIEIGALQDQRFRLCGQLSTDSAAKDLYC